jgi:hypothetical protein
MSFRILPLPVTRGPRSTQRRRAIAGAGLPGLALLMLAMYRRRRAAYDPNTIFILSPASAGHFLQDVACEDLPLPRILS